MFNVLDEQKENQSIARHVRHQTERAPTTKPSEITCSKNKNENRKRRIGRAKWTRSLLLLLLFVSYVIISMWNIFHSRTSNVAFSLTKFVPCRIDFVSSSASGTIAHTRCEYLLYGEACKVKNKLFTTFSRTYNRRTHSHHHQAATLYPFRPSATTSSNTETPSNPEPPSNPLTFFHYHCDENSAGTPDFWVLFQRARALCAR